MTATDSFQPRFKSGRLELGTGVAELMRQGKLDMHHYLNRHLSGDWGDIGKDARETNERALRRGGALYSSYMLTPDVKLLIVTADNRSETTLLLVPNVRIPI